jgi:pimeloyl-ACP methyl ester carboxylesterase
VLLHAFPLTAEMWRPQLDAVPLGWRIVAPDLAGLGHSDDREPVTSLDDYAQDLVALLDHLGVSSAAIGGLSMGGYTTLAVYRLAPERFAGILLADTRADADTPQGRLGRQTLLARLDAGGAPAVADDMLPKLLGATTRRTNPDLETAVRGLILANRPSGIGNAIRRMMARPDSTPLVADIGCPVFVLVGAEDALTSPAVARDLHGRIAGSTLAVIVGAGHLSSLEQPGAFNQALLQFLESVRTHGQ